MTSVQADALGAVGAVVGLLETAARAVKRLRKAHERQRNLVETLDKHCLAIGNVNDIVRTVADQRELQTSPVLGELKRLHALAEKLVKCLQELGPGQKGKARQLAHQLVRGSRDEETLADIMKDLDRAKASLTLHLQLASAGLTRSVHDTVLTSAGTIDRVDELLTKLFRESYGLKIDGLPRDVTRHGSYRFLSPFCAESDRPDTERLTDDGAITIVNTGSVFPCDPGTDDKDSATLVSRETAGRVIAGNSAQDTAVQIVGPVGEDVWEDAYILIENNTASGASVQIANPTSFEAFKYALDYQERRRHENSFGL